jgi:hypothetical protein
MSWIDETGIGNVDELFRRTLTLSKDNALLACRGQANSAWPLQASLDRILDAKADYASRLAEERALIESFRVRAREHLGRVEKQYVEGNERVGALAVLQHYGAPTRLLDWTYSPWVALYFAAIDHHDRPGAVWWFDQKSFEQEVGHRWGKEHYDMEDSYRRPGPNGQIDLNPTAFSTSGPPWVTGLHYPVPFHRIEVQQGFFTIAGRLGLEHEERIADVFDHRDTSGGVTQTGNQYARILVPAAWKQDILDRLRAMNIHSRSLDWPGADFVGADLTQSLHRSQLRVHAIAIS